MSVQIYWIIETYSWSKTRYQDLYYVIFFIVLFTGTTCGPNTFLNTVLNTINLIFIPYLYTINLYFPLQPESDFQAHIYRFIHLVVCLTTGPKPLPKRALYVVRSRTSFFKWKYPLLSLRLSSSFLRLLPCLPVTSIPSCIFTSITRCRKQFLRKMWPIQFTFRLRISWYNHVHGITMSP